MLPERAELDLRSLEASLGLPWTVRVSFGLSQEIEIPVRLKLAIDSLVQTGTYRSAASAGGYAEDELRLLVSSDACAQAYLSQKIVDKSMSESLTDDYVAARAKEICELALIRSDYKTATNALTLMAKVKGVLGHEQIRDAERRKQAQSAEPIVIPAFGETAA